ncbi:DUF3159 domain-containing protein [Tomitella biformata]|uniref:DUF3159 domain-containing protein n=1 Tax=Tomitella biformata TaxID=630403 RepID=UPI0004659B37|nr:DUF3159 domain-containing protein [Tomitella biformata]
MTEEKQESLLEQIGGVSGLVYSSLPILVFVPVNAIWDLKVALYAALGVAAAILIWRIAVGGKLAPAISGFIGVGISAYIAHRTGSAKGYFLFGIYTSLAYGGVFLLSVLVRWPLVGVIWNGINGSARAWRKERVAVRAYDLATLCWALVFGARYLVQSSLYEADSTGWLAVARIAMGWPLAAVAMLATFLAIRRVDRYFRALDEKEQLDGGPGDQLDSTDSAGANPSA